MIYLFDANVLIALADSAHIHHNRVQSWFHGRSKNDGWATCPLTENAFLRILGNPNYPAVSGTAQSLRPYLDRICAWPGHQFWPDSISLRDCSQFPTLPGAKKLTDLYLLGLAIANQGILATLDQRIDSSLIPGGESGLFLIP